MPNTYQLSQEMLRLQDALIESDGELTPDLEEALDSLTSDLAAKIDGWRAVYRNLKADVVALKHEEDHFKRRRIAAENGAKRLSRELASIMDGMGIPRIKGSVGSASVRSASQRSLTVETKPESLPERFQKVIPAQVVADNDAIRAAIAEGDEEALSHARLEEPTRYVVFQ